MARAGCDTCADDGLEPAIGSVAAAVPVSAVREIQGLRRSQRREELGLRGAMSSKASGSAEGELQPAPPPAVERNGVKIVDTFAEAFGMRGARVVITAQSPAWARTAALSMTGFATSVIGCKVEAGIEG